MGDCKEHQARPALVWLLIAASTAVFWGGLVYGLTGHLVPSGITCLAGFGAVILTWGLCASAGRKLPGSYTEGVDDGTQSAGGYTADIER